MEKNRSSTWYVMYESVVGVQCACVCMCVHVSVCMCVWEGGQKGKGKCVFARWCGVRVCVCLLHVGGTVVHEHQGQGVVVAPDVHDDQHMRATQSVSDS